eukprot:CAMPEP_0196825006 /NCGR_PEP_ID=MMETSP1362-20130617/92805_1 /TAXON_ID=163516 /ORGANISM="Leptocylindrus danicus, Strain CCMP1856" /LENGTH=286 /DNA_ID=CAMNT_0042205369 /DNA_START=2265 /DNA_END=3125 /DNA_ORIENTATION=+
MASSAQAFFRCLFQDFPVMHGGFHRLLTALTDGDTINATTDGSKIDSREASTGWLFWLCEFVDDEDDDDNEDLVVWRTCLLCGTILADGQFDDNTSFCAGAMGKLTITILLQCLYDFIGRTSTISTIHTCDNQALVKWVNNLHDNNNFHTINDPIDRDIIVPTAYWADRTNLKSKWVREHAERQKTDTTEWTDEEWANTTRICTPTEPGTPPRILTVPQLPSHSSTTLPSKSKLLVAPCPEKLHAVLPTTSTGGGCQMPDAGCRMLDAGARSPLPSRSRTVYICKA